MQASRIKLKDLVLKSGSHVSPEAGLCVMEAVAYFAKEPHSDKPVCACPVLTQYMIRLNDELKDDERQLLKPYIKLIIGTRDGNAQKRANVLAWASIVKFTPHSLALIGLTKEAAALKNVEKFNWSAAASAASAARSAANAAESAEWSAASAAASAAWSAESAARSAAESAEWSAASAASAARSAASAANAAESAEWSAADQKIARRKVIDMALEALGEALAIGGDQ